MSWRIVPRACVLKAMLLVETNWLPGVELFGFYMAKMIEIVPNGSGWASSFVDQTAQCISILLVEIII